MHGHMDVSYNCLYILLRLQWKTPDDGQRNCPKHVEFYSKNKLEKLVHLVGFVIRPASININKITKAYKMKIAVSLTFITNTKW
jgi:hypothetical protein